jgi:putative Mg2+ transporter-C (MgtC) family protein
MYLFYALAIPPEIIFTSRILSRLLLAAVLGGIIGIEREVRHKPAGLRTQMFICFGSAFFTVLSCQLAESFGGDHTRIAAQIILGIGFIGAGSILHARGSVTGLTTAATLFVVASIGMAVGGGLYLPTLFAALVLLLALQVLGLMETRFNLQPISQTYDVVAPDLGELLNTVDQILSDEQQVMQTVQSSRLGPLVRLQFTVEASQHDQDNIRLRSQQAPGLHRVQSFGPSEGEQTRR